MPPMRPGESKAFALSKARISRFSARSLESSSELKNTFKCIYFVFIQPDAGIHILFIQPFME